MMLGAKARRCKPGVVAQFGMAGDVLDLKGGAMHTFKNTGTVAATIVEVFGKAPKPAAAPR